MVALVGILYHLRIQPMAGDDVFFHEALKNTTLPAYLWDRYQTWTSRFVIEFLLVVIIKQPLLWRLINFLLFISFPILLSRIFGGGKLMNWCAAAAVLMYPFHDMGSAGWITTTVNYFWPLWGMFYVGMLLRTMLTEQKIPLPRLLAGIPVCLIASSHEQVAVILSAVFIMYVCYVHTTGQKIYHKAAFAGLWVANTATLVSIILCPGNAARNAVSIADLPIYETFHFGDKLYLGLLSIERVFIANADAVFFMAVLILFVLVFLKTDDYRKTLIAAVPLLILFGQTLIRTAYPGLSGLFVMPQQITEWSWGALSTWIPMGYLLVTVASMLCSLYVLLGDRPLEYIGILLLLGMGFGAGMVLGFMATIYVSGERVYITLYFILLFVTMLCIYRQRALIGEKIKQTGGKLFVSFLALLCLINIGFIALSC